MQEKFFFAQKRGKDCKFCRASAQGAWKGRGGWRSGGSRFESVLPPALGVYALIRNTTFIFSQGNVRAEQN